MIEASALAISLILRSENEAPALQPAGRLAKGLYEGKMHPAFPHHRKKAEGRDGNLLCEGAGHGFQFFKHGSASLTF